MILLPVTRSLACRSLVAAFATAVAAVALLASTAGIASAEEALVLDNGAILRGTVLKDEPAGVVLQLAGVGSESRVTIDRSRIVNRFVTAEPQRTTGRAPATSVPLVAPVAVRTVSPEPIALAAGPKALPAEEPNAAEETFFTRTARRAAMALPSEPAPRAFLGVLAFVVVTCLVGLGGRMVDVPGVTLGKGSTLAALYIGLVALNVMWSDPALRADWAPMFVPIELLAWVGCAATILHCNFGRAFNLLAFVLLSSALVVFSTGVMLVSV